MAAKTVLVVDDDPVMQELMEHYLVRAGYNMIRANNGREAIEMAARELPQLIIMDIAMPEVGGLAALKKLKATQATKDIPVIIATVHKEADLQVECENAGAAVVLFKPLSPRLLFAGLKLLIQ